MFKRTSIFIIIVIGICCPAIGFSNQCSLPETVVKCSTNNESCIRSIPNNFSGDGKTIVFKNGQNKETNLYEMNIYAYSEDFEISNDGHSVVYFPRGYCNLRDKERRNQDMLIVFYKDGQMLKQYSASEIAGKEDVSEALRSNGFKDNERYFEVTDVFGDIIKFDVATGAISSHEASPAIVKSSKNNIFCVRNILDGSVRKTIVLRKDGEKETALYTMDWFDFKDNIFITDDGHSVVRIHSWSQERPNDKDLAIAFYGDGELLKQYSTLDIISTVLDPAQLPMGLVGERGPGGQRYFIFNTKEGDEFEDKYFKIYVQNGNVIKFDTATGKMIK